MGRADNALWYERQRVNFLMQFFFFCHLHEQDDYYAVSRFTPELGYLTFQPTTFNFIVHFYMDRVCSRLLDLADKPVSVSPTKRGGVVI